MKFYQVLLVAAVGALVALGAAQFLGGTQKNPAMEQKETAFERVMRTNTLRCGYLFWANFLEKDPQTGAFSGMYYDLLEEIGRQLSLKIEWTEEVTASTMYNGLDTGRYDVACVPANATPGRARAAEFTLPILFTPTFLYARADDSRFDNDYQKINDSKIKVAVLDGEMSQTIKKEDFPKAQTLSMSDIADIPQVLLQVSMGKADVAMTEPSSAEPFLEHNPGKLKRVPGPSLRTQAAGLEVGLGEEELKSLLNTTIDSLGRMGFLERLIVKYSKTPDMFFTPAETWRKVTNVKGKES